jgi:nicotinamide-nucleotide amidase
MWFEKDGKIYVSLPGVPHEMKGLMINEVLPRIPKYFELPLLFIVRFYNGHRESMIAEKIKNLKRFACISSLLTCRVMEW